MEGRLVWFGIGMVYGAALGVMAYRWWQAREQHLDWRFSALNSRLDEVFRHYAASVKDAAGKDAAA